MATTPKYQHPEYPACTWSGRGAKPYWVRQHLMEGRALDELLINKVTVTENTGIDQAQLPGLPPIPKKRGRPVTGKAKTAAQRKREQRRRVGDLVAWGTLAEFDQWVELASVSQLCEAFPVILQERGGDFALIVAERLARISQASTK